MLKLCTVLVSFVFIMGKAQSIPKDSDQSETFFTEQKQLGKPIWNYIYGDFSAFNSQGKKAFLLEIDSLRALHTEHLKSYEKKISDSLYYQEENAIKAAFDKLILEYPGHHEVYSGHATKLPDTLVDYLDKGLDKFKNIDLLKNKDVRAYIRAYINKKASDKVNKGLFKQSSNQHLSAQWQIIDSLFSDSIVLPLWKYRYLSRHIENLGVKNIEDYYKDFLKSKGNEAQKASIYETYQNHLQARQNHLIKTYKKVDGFDLDIHLFLPDGTNHHGPRPTLVYFHGGSWSEGKPDWFFDSGKEYSKRGWVAVAVEYRIKERHNSLPFEAVKDAKSAIRWLRQNAAELNVAIDEIVVTGNSAGGHLALSTILSDTVNEATDNLAMDPVPNAAMVNAAVYDLTVTNSKWIVRDLANKDSVLTISPNHRIKKTHSKLLMIHGEKDKNCEYSTAVEFYKRMKALGNDIELKSIPEAGHFIWFGRFASEVYPKQAEFLSSLNF
ncbi:alpha/beta hydrolase [Flagellimonas sp.]|uniref:alpha/beta hydrolase n=1 Tax=Flagellimonas sp. TaxID=2058762 RepID=UPI003F49C2C6